MAADPQDIQSMKKIFYSDIHDIRTVEDPDGAYRLIREARKMLTTYNQLMSHYESESRDIGVIFITSKDSMMFQHLPLFCSHFDIELYALPNGAEDYLSSMLKKRYVSIVCLYKDEPSIQRFVNSEAKMSSAKK